MRILAYFSVTFFIFRVSVAFAEKENGDLIQQEMYGHQHTVENASVNGSTTSGQDTIDLGKVKVNTFEKGGIRAGPEGVGKAGSSRESEGDRRGEGEGEGKRERERDGSGDRDGKGEDEGECQCAAEKRDGGKEVSKAEEGMFPLLALADELFVSSALLTAWGVTHWDWFTERMSFHSEHGFSSRSPTGGADKAAHFFDAYFMADLMNWRLREYGYSRGEAAFWGAAGAMVPLLWIEIGDSTSSYGFSLEDLLADIVGVAASWALNFYPPLRGCIDFRLQYWPTSRYLKSGNLVADYSGMKFIAALKLAGFPLVGETPLRFVETHFGFYSRGFRTFDEAEEEVRAIYLGLGIDLYQLFHPILPDFILTFLRYYQPPYTSLPVVTWKFISHP
jgi:hypothetical protein